MALPQPPPFWQVAGLLRWQEVEYRAKLVRPVSMPDLSPPKLGWSLAVYFPGMAGTPNDIDKLAADFASATGEPFVLVVPARRSDYWWFVGDSSQWGWVQGDFNATLVDAYVHWLEFLSRLPGIDETRVGLFGYSAGAYAAAEVFAHASIPVCGVGFAGLHGHGQPDLNGLPAKRARANPVAKFDRFLERMYFHPGAAWIEASHAERDSWSRIYDARCIIEAISARQESLGRPPAILRTLGPAEEDRKTKDGHSYFRAAFVRSEFFAGLLGGSVRCSSSSRSEQQARVPRPLLRPSPLMSPVVVLSTHSSSSSTRTTEPIGVESDISTQPDHVCETVPDNDDNVADIKVRQADLKTRRVNVATPKTAHSIQYSRVSCKDALRVIKILDPLRRDWHSSRFGELQPINLARRAVEGNEMICLHMACSEPCRFCNIIVQNRTVYLLADDASWRLCPRESKPRSGPIVWRSEDDETIEVWYGDLADAAAKARLYLSCALTLPEGFHQPRSLELQPSVAGLTVGFCVTVKNRLWQLEHSLPSNLASLWPFRACARLHLVDFGSKDGGREFVDATCQAALAAGLLKVYHSELEFVHAAVMKNTALAVASEDVLVSLDCDDLFDPHFVVEVRQHFEAGAKALCCSDLSGSCSRVACQRSDFVALGAFDEDSRPLGAHDDDFVERVKMLYGHSSVIGAPGSCSIGGAREDLMLSVDPRIGLTFEEMEAENRQVFRRRRIEEGIHRSSSRRPLRLTVLP